MEVMNGTIITDVRSVINNDKFMGFKLVLENKKKISILLNKEYAQNHGKLYSLQIQLKLWSKIEYNNEENEEKTEEEFNNECASIVYNNYNEKKYLDNMQEIRDVLIGKKILNTSSYNIFIKYDSINKKKYKLEFLLEDPNHKLEFTISILTGRYIPDGWYRVAYS